MNAEEIERKPLDRWIPTHNPRLAWPRMCLYRCLIADEYETLEIREIPIHTDEAQRVVRATDAIERRLHRYQRMLALLIPTTIARRTVSGK